MPASECHSPFHQAIFRAILMETASLRTFLAGDTRSHRFAIDLAMPLGFALLSSQVRQLHLLLPRLTVRDLLFSSRTLMLMESEVGRGFRASAQSCTRHCACGGTAYPQSCDDSFSMRWDRRLQTFKNLLHAVARQASVYHYEKLVALS